ncbi:MAG: hypothetical protein B7X32_09345 [Microbacterium sp. 13-71-7]|jgi:multidrug efflux pump subunit AcrA (membrane-fusion protein)|nr:MAG: hypothetical protein B7X32_09345 [Microbacterium sp. 13-71-7]
MAVKQASAARVQRDLTAIAAGQRMAGAEPTPADMDAARAVLEHRLTADEAVSQRLADIDRAHGISR